MFWNMGRESIVSWSAGGRRELRRTRPILKNDGVMTAIEKEYALHIHGLTGEERLQVAALMVENLRSAYELQIRRTSPDLAGTALRVAVARRMYCHDPRTLALLNRLGQEP